MEATVVSVGKAVLDGALDYAKSTVAEEMALQLGIEHDVGFITDELEMMQSFLMTADEERGKNNKVHTTWVKQVRDVAYNVEDSLMDFTVHAEREKPHSLGCIPHNLCDRRRIAMEVKELKAKVEDVSNRNRRYRLIKDGVGGSKSASITAERGGVAAGAAAAAMFGMDEAWRAGMDEEKAKADLRQLIISEEVDRRVIALWGTSGDLGKMSEICKVFDDPKVKAKFGCRAWVRLAHHFDPKEFLHSMVRQFYENSSLEDETAMYQGVTVGGNVLLKMEKMGQSDLVRVFSAHVSSNSYLIVIDGLSTMDEWRCIQTYFPDKKKGSRIVVATQKVEIASLCTEQPHQVSELKQLSSDQILYLFHKKVEEREMDSAKPISKSSDLIIEIEEEGAQQSNDTRSRNVVPTSSRVQRQHDHRKTREVIPEDIVVGRKTEKQKLIGMIGHPDNRQRTKVISVWGMGGIGKTTLVRSVYRSQELGGWKRAWATVLRPFNHEVLLRHLALQLEPNIQEDSTRGDGEKQKKKNIGAMEFQEMIGELSRFIEIKSCLIAIDDLSSTEEWDSIKHYLLHAKRIIVTTRGKTVAEHCSENGLNIFSLKGLEDDAALDLFKKKVFKDAASFDLHPHMLGQAKLILKRCDGLPLAISTIGSYLANKPKTATEWRMLNDGLSAELEINPNLKMIKTVLMRSYDGLPYHLKVIFLYLSVFPEDHIIRRKSVVRRWIAEGYSREMHHMTAEKVGDKHFDELIDRSMILPSESGIPGKIDSCQLHDLIREICVSKAREENFVFTLEEGCSLGSTQGAIRHLTISSNWKRDKDVMQRMLDLSHVRSLTVFGEWRPYFISNKMRFLRVLNLEHTTGLRDHHLDKIGELLHLRYLSLRGCNCILRLPDSLANLGQLQTLDVRGTRICTLPAAVAKLQKLQYLHASGLIRGDTTTRRDIYTEYSWLMDDNTHSRACCVFKCCCGLSTCGLLLRCCKYFDRATALLCTGFLFCRQQLLESRFLVRRRGQVLEDGVSRQDLCHLYSYYIMDEEGDWSDMCGVKIPRGISKLRTLHTLRSVNVARGKDTTFDELRELTQLRKLGVVGVHYGNRKMFWRSIAGHDRLQSLSIERYNWKEVDDSEQELDGCLDGSLRPPKCLESLKMRCKLVKVTEWIHGLQNLSKLQLEEAKLNQEALQAIGMLPNLEVLRLKKESLSEQKILFRTSSFPSLLLLELHEVRFLKSVEFKQEAMPKLEVFQAYKCEHIPKPEFSGLQFLTSLKEIRLDDYLKEKVQSQLDEHPNNVIVKLM
ncbi:unnamed protein product [Urochloa decumbens]|uniref:Uncharacterized protein n=1 Tax=Urochloa decumbens TaxID=240449 RepID=A0ABC9AMW8_9POAL